MEKNKRKVILAGLLCLIVTFCIVGYNMLGRQKSNNRSMAIYIPNANGEGYTLSNYSKIPAGYMLNETESYCNNGSVLSWVNDGISITSTRSDACHIYLDEKADPIAVGTNTLTFTDNKIKINKTFNTSTEESIEKYFTIETGNSAGIIDLYWEDLKNTYLFGSLQYTLSYSTTENGSYTNIVEDKYVPRNTNSEGITKVLEKQLKVPANSTYYYKLKIQYVKWTYRDQSADANASLNTKFTIVQGKDYDAYATKNRLKTTMEVNERTGSITYSGNFLRNNSKYGFDSFNGIYTHDSIDIPSGADSWDVSDAGNGSVMAWTANCSYDSDYNEYYDCDLHIGQEGGVIANPMSKYLFKDFTYVTTIDLLHFDTSIVENYLGMFYNNNELQNLDVSRFDTYKGTNMSWMFYSCGKLSSLNLSNFDTSNVTDMSTMMRDTYSLTSIDVSSFDTHKVTSMYHMFKNVGSGANSSTYDTIDLDLSHFDTQNVQSMIEMFYQSYNIRTLDVSNFDTSNVINFQLMFYRTHATYLDLSSFEFKDTATTTNMLRDLSRLESIIFNDHNYEKLNAILYNAPSGLKKYIRRNGQLYETT